MAKVSRQALFMAPADARIEARIGLLAEQFARDILAVIRGSRLEELLAVTQAGTQGGSLPASSVTAAMALGDHGGRRRRRRWPTCVEPDCTGSYYPASGTSHLCYKHFIAAGGRHPNSRR